MPDRWDDERIRDEINDKLSGARLDLWDIQVAVEAGEVTLSGTVDSGEMKTLVEELCDTTKGVTEVTNLLRVAREHDGQIAIANIFGGIDPDWRR
jgi:osmotically-inducible protein OsmY